MKSKKERNLGQFYTPTLFVDYAHKMISEQFGEDWKEKFVVWDNCSGTKNLTRDYFFKELYCSTLENAELEISERYNREATAFQFDFLNDSLDKSPQGLKDALENNKPIIFFLNPPYARAGKSEDGDGRMGTGKGSALTMVNQQMKDDKIGACSANLYAQFLYRIMMIKAQYNLTNCVVALFSPKNFLSTSSYKVFREKWFNNFVFSNACQFKASHFADVADNWSISFSIWKNGVSDNKNEFNYSVVDENNGEVKKISNSIVYNIDNSTSLSEWLKIKISKTLDIPTMKSALKIGDKSLKTNENVLAWFTNGNNNIYHSSQDVFLMECPNGIGKTNTPVLKENFERVVASFSARKVVEMTCYNSDDEYFAPNTDNEKWGEFVNDSLVYSLFSAFSQQSSLRQVEYKDKLWDIKNEFFFMSKNEVMDLANENGFDFTYNDAKVSNERYVYEKLQQIDLSKEAQAVLDKATELTINSFKYRELFNDEHPEYQIMNWDCGWYQIKGMLKEFMPQEYKEFVELFKALAEKMRPMVYELGFLK